MKRREFIGALGCVALCNSTLFAKMIANPWTFVWGGGVFSLGYALAHPDDTLVVSRGIHLGSEFSLTCGPHEIGEPATPLGRELLDALHREELIVNGVLQLLPLSDFLSVFFAKHGGNSLMGADLADVNAKDNEIFAQIIGSGGEGYFSLPITKFVDTSDLGWRNLGVGDVAGRSFGVQTTSGCFSVDLPSGADIRDARLALGKAWKESGRNQNEMLAEVGAMKTRYKDGRIERRFTCDNGRVSYSWIPSAQFSTFIGAFEEGLACGLR